MRRKIVAKTLLTLALTSLLLLMPNTVTVRALSQTIYIRPDGSIDPPTAPIQRNEDIYTFTDNINETIVVQRDNIIVDGNSYKLQGSGSGAGFDLSNRNNVTIKKTHITQWNYGIHLYNQSVSNTISDNNLTGNIKRAIFTSNSSSNIISRNKVTNNNGDGIFLWLTNTTTVSQNNVSNNSEDGIALGHASFNNTIINNTVSSNIHAGISLPFETPTDNVITGNNITNNVWAGIYISWATASNNTFYHNNMNNTLQILNVEATNTWDNSYPSGGNYWSNYAGVDLYSGTYQNETGSDGIGDTPHIIDAINHDNYPFVNPWTPQAIDIATTNTTPSKTIVGQGYALQINVTATNQGSYTQTFSVIAYANATSIETKTATLGNGNSTIFTFTWDTTTVPYGSYTISAYANPLPGEVDTADNTYTDGTVLVTVPGDVNGDRIVDIFDIGAISAHWYPGPPIGPLGFGGNTDINNDGAVDIFDIGTTSAHWGQTW